MALLRCKACGKLYSYEKEGFCPKCGAYNRPPRKEWVDADGSVHYMKQRQADSGIVPPHDGRKVCFEQETERPRKKAAVNWTEAYQNVQKAAASGSMRHSLNSSKGVCIAIAVAVAALIISSISGTVRNEFVTVLPESVYPDYGTTEWEPAAQYIQYVEPGETFWIGDTALTVSDYCWMRQDEVTFLQVPVITSSEEEYGEAGEVITDARLVWGYAGDAQQDGWLAPAEVAHHDDGVWHLSYDVFPLMEENWRGELIIAETDIANAWVVFTDEESEIWVTLPPLAEW